MEIWNAFDLKDRNVNESGPYRKWAIRAEEANSRAIEVHRSYAGSWSFNATCDRALQVAEQNAIRGSFAMRSYTPQEKTEALSSPQTGRSAFADPLQMPLQCVSVPLRRLEIFMPGNWKGFPDNDDHFPMFVIGLDPTGRPIEHTCNSAKVTRSDHEIPGAQHHMTEVYFRAEVLDVFKNNSESFRLQESKELGSSHLLRAREGWSLPIGFTPKEPEDGVMVRLGDLGCCIPWNVRKHFKEFNIAPP